MVPGGATEGAWCPSGHHVRTVCCHPGPDRPGFGFVCVCLLLCLSIFVLKDLQRQGEAAAFSYPALTSDTYGEAFSPLFFLRGSSSVTVIIMVLVAAEEALALSSQSKHPPAHSLPPAPACQPLSESCLQRFTNQRRRNLGVG